MVIFHENVTCQSSNGLYLYYNKLHCLQKRWRQTQNEEDSATICRDWTSICKVSNIIFTANVVCVRWIGPLITNPIATVSPSEIFPFWITSFLLLIFVIGRTRQENSLWTFSCGHLVSRGRGECITRKGGGWNSNYSTSWDPNHSSNSIFIPVKCPNPYWRIRRLCSIRWAL